MGLKLYRRKDSASWYIRGTIRGQRHDASAGTSDKRLAEAIRVKIERELLEGSVHGKERTLTFADAAASYIEYGAPARFITTKRSDGTFTGIGEHFKDRILGEITQEDLDRAARTLHPGAQAETLNRQVYTPFIAIWNHAFSDVPNMARKWRRPRKQKGTNISRKTTRTGSAPVDYERAARFIVAMSPAPGMLMAFLFYTGLRPIEAFALTARDINVDKRWIVVRSSKTGEPRGVPLHDWLAEWVGPIVERAVVDGKPVFRTPRGEPYGEIVTNIRGKGGGGLKSAINGARRRSGIHDVSPYTARHSVSTGLVVAGCHPHVKDQILGHAADSMSRHYTNVPQAPLIEAINLLPVPARLRGLPWWRAPLEWAPRLAEGTGKRNDLIKMAINE